MRGRRWAAALVAALAMLGVVPVVAAAATTGKAKPRVTNIERRVTAVVRRIESISGDVATKETPKEIEVTLAADVLFAFNSADLAPDAAAKVDELARQLDADGKGPVRIVGHTDSKGTDAYNQDLSRRRASSVRDALSAKAGAFTYTVDGKGATEPVAPNEKPDGSDNPDGRARNRRVTITFARKG